MNTDALFTGLPVTVPDVLIPNTETDLKKWAVIACDQYTQDREYWEKAAAFVGGSPSALHLILPEVYLGDKDKAGRISAIKKTMAAYLRDGVFAPPVHGLLAIERTLSGGRIRKGLLCAVDLERYDWRPEAKAEICATEETIADRIPPRMEIRRGAALESPHIMLLANDPGRTFVEAAGELAKAESGGRPLYATELMAGGGAVTAWKLTGRAGLEQVQRALTALAAQNTAPDGSRFLFAAGDGNHSLATAKAVWEERKKNGAPAGHPAQYALVEIVNLYDGGLTFEPIHRALFGVTLSELVRAVAAQTGGAVQKAESFSAAQAAAESENHAGNGTRKTFVFAQNEEAVLLRTENPALGPSILQPVLDGFLRSHPGADIDYIHGTAEAGRLSSRNHAAVVLMPPISKDGFFPTVAEKGSLPRKSFSMGEADEKRFYLECRKIILPEENG